MGSRVLKSRGKCEVKVVKREGSIHSLPHHILMSVIKFALSAGGLVRKRVDAFAYKSARV